MIIPIFVAGVASALAELHRLAICHGDVYAHNVLANASGNAVLCDYGESESRAPGCCAPSSDWELGRGRFLLHLAISPLSNADPAGLWPGRADQWLYLHADIGGIAE